MLCLLYLFIRLYINKLNYLTKFYIFRRLPEINLINTAYEQT